MTAKRKSIPVLRCQLQRLVGSHPVQPVLSPKVKHILYQALSFLLFDAASSGCWLQARLSHSSGSQRSLYPLTPHLAIILFLTQSNSPGCRTNRQWAACFAAYPVSGFWLYSAFKFPSIKPLDSKKPLMGFQQRLQLPNYWPA